MKNFLLLTVLFLASNAQAALTKVPYGMISGGPRLAGESYFAGTASCSWTRTSATVGAFNTSATCTGPTIVFSVLGTWATTDSDLPRQTITSLPAGYYKAKFLIPSIQTAGGSGVLAINDGTTTCEPVKGNDYTGTIQGVIVECSFYYASAGTRVFEIYGGTSSNTIHVNNATITPRASTKFILEYWGNY